MKKNEPTKIQGIIVASSWNENGEISTLDLAAYDERKYRIVNNEIGNELRTQLKKVVIVEGNVREKNNQLMIHVIQYQVGPPIPENLTF